MTRDERQKIVQEKFLINNAVGTCEATPGFGKTRVGLNLIRHLRRKNEYRTVLIVVPTDYLLQQWEDLLKKDGLEKNTKVKIINSVIKEKNNVDFLILDRNFVQLKAI